MMNDGDYNPIEILEFYRSAGVDIALEDAPVDCFALSKAEKEKAKAQKPTAQNSLAGKPLQHPGQQAGRGRTQMQRPSASQPQSGPIPDNRDSGASLQEFDPKIIEEARDLARSAEDLEALKKYLLAFEGCRLKKTAKNTVFADGNPQAKLMLIGEAPGAEEDQQGLPFVGRSGRLLDRILAAIGHDRQSVYISNILPWRPPGNRTPTPHEIEICRPFIERHIELIDPAMIVLLGGISAKALLNEKTGIMRLRGKWRQLPLKGREVPVMPTFHPAYLLRNPSAKARVWSDFLSLRRKYEESVAKQT